MNDSLREQLVTGASCMGIELDDAAVLRFSLYLTLLQRWGKKINLTTRLGDEDVVVYHFLDSLAGAPFLAASPAARVVDLGAGAGLPSLPLKFALPGLRPMLIESVRKKTAFCQEAILAIGISETKAIWGRGEEISAHPEHHQTYDWAVCRALGPAADVARLAFPFLAPGGQVLLYKGCPEPEELQALEMFCAERRAVWQLSPVSVPRLKGARSLIVISWPSAATADPVFK